MPTCSQCWRWRVSAPPGTRERPVRAPGYSVDVTDTAAVVAMLVDADNASLQSLDSVLADLALVGHVQIRRAYGNWFKAALRPWDAELSRRGFRAVQQSDPVKGKNATDLALVIDAVDLHHTLQPDVFALVSSDSDYTPLAVFLRERGATVLGFGRPTTPTSFRAACTSFTALRVEQPSDEATGTAKQPPKPARPASLEELLADAVARNADKQGWARVNAVANHMRQQHGAKARDHGKASWTKVLKGIPGYEFRHEGTTDVAVRVKAPRG